MKFYLLLLLLLPAWAGKKTYELECYYGKVGKKVKEDLCAGYFALACYTKDDGELGCHHTMFCKNEDVKCCFTDLCNKPK